MLVNTLLSFPLVTNSITDFLPLLKCLSAESLNQCPSHHHHYSIHLLSALFFCCSTSCYLNIYRIHKQTYIHMCVRIYIYIYVFTYLLFFITFFTTRMYLLRRPGRVPRILCDIFLLSLQTLSDFTDTKLFLLILGPFHLHLILGIYGRR